MMDDVIRRLERYCLHAPGDALVGDALSLILSLLAERAQLMQTVAQKENKIQELRAILREIAEDDMLCTCGPYFGEGKAMGARVLAALGGG